MCAEAGGLVSASAVAAGREAAGKGVARARGSTYQSLEAVQLPYASSSNSEMHHPQGQTLATAL